MRRMTRRLIAPSMAAALVLSMGAAEAAVEEKGGREAVVLRVSIDGQLFDVTAPIGDPVRLVDRAGVVHLLVPVRTPGPEGSEPQLALEVYESVRVHGADERNLLEVVPLPGIGKGSVMMLASRRPVEVEAVGVRELPWAGAAAPDAELRPINCCISCDGIEACGFCVEAWCGVCCSF